jgi:signal transduction histidine kinase
MAEEKRPPQEESLRPTRADWILLAVRVLLAVGLLLQSWLAPIDNAAPPDLTQYVLFAYIGLILIGALFLWRKWALGVWPQITLVVDILVILVVLYLNGGVTSPLLPVLLLPVVATSMRLGFSGGLGFNLAALAGYILLVMQGVFAQNPDLHIAQAVAFGAVILSVGTLGGLLAEQIALPAHEDIHRYEERIEELREQHDAASTRAQVFYEMSRTLSVTLSYQRVLEGVLQGCRRVLDFSVGVVLLSAGPESLSCAAAIGLRPNESLREVQLAGGVLSTCLATADPMILESLGKDIELNQVVALQKCRSGLCVPLRVGLRNYGVIVLGSLNEKAYKETDLSQLVALAHFATIAIQNAQLYQDLREERDKIISATENVRKELSRDLHDGPAQSLAAIAMNVEFIKRLLRHQPDQAISELDNLEQLARKTSWDVRTMLFELRPIILETKGLVPTLEQYVQRFPETEEPRVQLDTGGFNQRLDPKTETTVFTIMQEAVNNARKHAKAKHIWLRLQQKGSDLVAAVQDDGVGFDLEAVKASYEKRGSFGLLNMHERAELVGGRTEIRSEPGKGTAVIITVPLERN